jgi:shikimate kinase
MADQTLTLPRSVVLVGLMAAGKSCIGHRLAARLGLPFIDADTEIEAAIGCTISEFFARHGEPAFRQGERQVMARLLDGPLCVLATGGGAFINPETRRMVGEKSISVWLRADLDLLVRRTAGCTHRPLLLTADPREILGRLMDQRYPIYAEADITVDTSDQPPEVTMDVVYRALAAHLAAPSRTT